MYQQQPYPPQQNYGYPQQQGGAYPPQGGYAPQYGAQPQGYPMQQQGYPMQQPQTVVIVQTGAPLAMHNWHSECLDVCAAPGGLPLCIYGFLFPCCAAGDIAVAAGRDYLCSCFIAPLLSHMFHHDTSWIEACAWYMDRTALAARYGVNDVLDQSGGCFSMAYLYFACGCAPCLLIQELNHVRWLARGSPQRAHLCNSTPSSLPTATFHSHPTTLFRNVFCSQQIKAAQMGLVPGPMGMMPQQKSMF